MVSDESHKQLGKILGANLRAARLACRFSQSQLAGSDFSVSYVSSIERGRTSPSLLTLEILARRVGLSSAQLLPNDRENYNIHSSPSLSVPIRTEAEIDRALLEAEVSLLQEATVEEKAYLNMPLMTNLMLQQQLLARYLHVRAYLKSGQLEKAEYALSEVVKPASGLNNRYLMVQLLYLQGRVCAAMHNYDQAISVHSDCLKLLEQTSPRNPFLLAQLHSDLGLHYMCLDKTEKAIEQFQYAISLTKALISSQNLQSIYWNLAQEYRQAEEYYLAALYAQKCLYLQSGHLPHPSLRGEIYYYLGRAMLKGDQEKAHTFLEEALQLPSVLQDQLALASITVHLSKWLFMHEALKEAEEHAQKALNMAKPFGDTLILAEALLMCGRIAYVQTRYEEGDTYFLTAFELLDRLGMYEELTSESVDYAQLLEQRGKEHEAIIHYKRALESSQKLGRSGR